MPRIGQNPSRGKTLDLTPARTTIAVLVYAPHQAGYFQDRLDVTRMTIESILSNTQEPFNLLVFDGTELVYTSNKSATQILEPGYYGLSNAELGAQWPKCVRGAQGLKQIVQSDFGAADLVGLLHDSDVPPDEDLPHRGRPISLERRTASCFIVGDEYGTRASTIIVMSDDNLKFTEQSYLAGGISAGLVDYDLPV